MKRQKASPPPKKTKQTIIYQFEDGPIHSPEAAQNRTSRNSSLVSPARKTHNGKQVYCGRLYSYILFFLWGGGEMGRRKVSISVHTNMVLFLSWQAWNFLTLPPFPTHT